jgi:UDP-N-acetyl-D-mannosaminuronic acid dehydrogenase
LSPTSVVIVGGCGHVGLPLAISLADAGVRCVAFDLDEAAVDLVNSGVMPFLEAGADPVLHRVLEVGAFAASTDPSVIAGVDVVVVVIGTPVDDHMNPDPNAVVSAIRDCLPYMDDSQLVVLRSTVYPGVTGRVEMMLAEAGLGMDVAFCPERIVEGQAMSELRELPQIVGARNDLAANRASALFEALGVRTIRVLPEEAELAKLFTNTWRYIKFAAANQFWLMANEAGLDFARIREAITFEYPRASDLPGAGFAAGPCLFKDTMQLAAFTNNNFLLGHSAMMVNEGQPMYVVDRIAARHDLPETTVGILGMAFKAGSDDTRSSLSYKLKRILRFKAKGVLTTDPYVKTDPGLLPLEEVLERADILVIGTPHPEYRDLATDKPVVDVWNLLGNGTLV